VAQSRGSVADPLLMRCSSLHNLIVVIAILLAASHQVVTSQGASGLALIDVPIPTYPAIVTYARMSGDVNVTLDVRPL
jgi:hypothetical protein